MSNSVAEIDAAVAAVGASVWDRRIASLLAHHAADEEHVLASYRWLLDQPTSPAVKYLVKLIVEDEERHHRILLEMARAIAWGPVAHHREDATPPLTPYRDDTVADLTESFLEVERNDRTELKRIAHELRPVAATTPLGVLVDVMLLDTEKHIKILEFLKRAAHRSAG